MKKRLLRGKARPPIGVHDLTSEGRFVAHILEMVPNPPSIGFNASFGFERVGDAANGREAVIWATLATMCVAPGYVDSFGPGTHQLPIYMDDARAFLREHDEACKAGVLESFPEGRVSGDIVLVINTLSVMCESYRRHHSGFAGMQPKDVIAYYCKVLRDDVAAQLRQGFTVH